MLAGQRGFYRNGKEVELLRTPLLLPSFSSKGFPVVQEIIDTTKEVIDGPILVSAYDLYHGNVEGPFDDFAEAIFLDSGGYEANKAVELGEHNHRPSRWSETLFKSVIRKWISGRPTIIISYDHPNIRYPIAEQISRAAIMVPITDNTFREILLKPEKKGGTELNMEAIEANINGLSVFDSIGITEKEIGRSLQDRLENIARLRRALNGAGMGVKPIHVFGSLDTISTPMYFIAGADIFDGLTWLRLAYREGLTIYTQNYAALEKKSAIKSTMINGMCWFDNYYYLTNMQLEMRNFAETGDINSFKYHHELIKLTCSRFMQSGEE